METETKNIITATCTVAVAFTIIIATIFPGYEPETEQVCEEELYNWHVNECVREWNWSEPWFSTIRETCEGRAASRYCWNKPKEEQ